MEWTPIESPKSLGKLPEFNNKVACYNLNEALPSGVNAKEFLVYAFITSMGEGDEFQRGYYEISCKANDGKDLVQYMNVATGPSVSVVNSVNLWFPIPNDAQLRIKLYHSKCDEQKKTSIAGTLAGQDWSDVFVVGYR
ncbi:uncharacterized protein LOC110251054 [Exaiptasia diaphana]|uniref:Uncharacterized protein n=1 Tax=Exaiptasia diaphana TaxID=2652724 RepID=A0A913Y1P6_EXADI|nr:uncharacterized protein LOC110251054 [Exaiptasia diaphana]KXJ23232.1 hypothetical protein AC249_AIPGENE3870 [Exaiptasia diaphana]